jgi:hypothetical protein
LFLFVVIVLPNSVSDFKKKHRKNCEKLPWELVGCQGVEVMKQNVTKLKNSNCEEKKT